MSVRSCDAVRAMCVRVLCGYYALCVSTDGQWASDGSIPEAGLVVHCFDGNEDRADPWRPGIATGTAGDHPSASVIFREQCVNGAGRLRWAPGALLFGHACGGGGIIFRPGKMRILCGHDRDYGARCAREPTDRATDGLART